MFLMAHDFHGAQAYPHAFCVPKHVWETTKSACPWSWKRHFGDRSRANNTKKKSSKRVCKVERMHRHRIEPACMCTLEIAQYILIKHIPKQFCYLFVCSFVHTMKSIALISRVNKPCGCRIIVRYTRSISHSERIEKYSRYFRVA